MKRLRNVHLPIVPVFLFMLGLAAHAAAKDYLYVPCSNYLHIIDCDTDTVIKTLSYNDYISGCATSKDRKRFYFSAWRSMYVVDTDTNQIIDKHEFWSELNRITVSTIFSVSPDGRYLYMIWMITKKKMNVPRLNVLPNQFVIYDLQERQVVKNYEAPNNCFAVVDLKDDPDHVVLMADDVYKMNIKSGKTEKIMGILHPREGQPALNCMVGYDNRVSGDHGMFSGPAYGAEAMYYLIVDGRGDVRLLKADHFAPLYSSIISPDTKYLYAAMDEVYKVDMKTGKALAFDPIERGTVYSLATTSDGKKLYVGPAGPDLSVYDTETMKRIGMIPLKSDGPVLERITK